MAMSKAIVSTSVGIEGLPVRDGEHLIVADAPEAFASAVTQLLCDVKQRKRIERNARSFVETHCSWVKVAEVFADVCRRVIDGPSMEEKLSRPAEAQTAQPLPHSVYDA